MRYEMSSSLRRYGGNLDCQAAVVRDNTEELCDDWECEEGVRCGQEFQVFITGIKVTFEINKHFIPQLGGMQAQMKQEERDSTPLPLVLTAVSRCQFTSPSHSPSPM